jgi:Glycosyl transferases group 1
VKILLINEASGVHHYLKQGLQQLGHEVIHAMPSGATQQGRPADYFFGAEGAGWLPRLKRHVLPLWRLRRFRDVEVVNFVLGISAFVGRGIKYRDLGLLERWGTKLSYLGTGCDEVALLRVRPGPGELACRSCQAHDALGRSCEAAILSWRTAAADYARLFSYTVSPCVEYDHAHGFFPSATHRRIPLPINVDAIEFVPARAQGTPVIVHSPTRRGFKGTHAIIQAVEILRQRRAQFEFDIVENLPHREYLERMGRADIVIDQAYTESAGVAALENLAMGKIVVSGNGPAAREYFAFGKDSPIVDAPSEPHQLADVVQALLGEQGDFQRRAEAGRRFVATYHDHVGVARQYLELWGS